MRPKLALGAAFAAVVIGAVVAVARWYVPLAPHALGAPAAAPPDRAGIAVVLAGFGLWLGGCVAFARRGLDGEDRLVPRAAAQAGGLVLVGMVVWLVGLYSL